MSKGILLVDKPQGITSYKVVDIVKKRLGIKKVGHGGTLDPFATGLLVILVGREYTKRQSEFMKGKKEYETTILFGVSTDTGDPTGKIIKEVNSQDLDIEDVFHALKNFEGEILQRPHPYSAVKFNGRPLYFYARRGIRVDIPSRKVEVYNIEVLDFCNWELRLKLTVSGGFYVRSFAVDLGKSLDIPAMVKELRRIRVGHFNVEDALKLEVIKTFSKEELEKTLIGV